ncbi:MAG: DUF5666 domain-containing protein [Candidatus Dormibacteria bacterium]
MFKSVAARALLGVGILGAAGGTTALAASPSTNAPAAKAGPAARHHAHHAVGVIIARSDTEITVERTHRDKTARAPARDDAKYVITAATKVFRAGSKDPVGHDALKTGERVRLSYSEADGKSTAARVVIMRDLRAGRVLSKGANSLRIHTRKHGDVTVTVTDRTVYRSGKAAGSFDAIKVGDVVTALGEEDAAHNFDASAIRYHAPHPKPARAPKAAA